MIALWTSRAGVIPIWGASKGPPSPPRSETPRRSRRAPRFCSASWGASKGPPSPPRSETPRRSRGSPRNPRAVSRASTGPPSPRIGLRRQSRRSKASSVVGREELRDEGRDPVLHLGERHRIDDLVADAVVVLAAEVRLAPEIVELDDAEGVGDLLRIDALRLLHRGDEGEGRIGEVDAGRVPFTELLRVARLPALDLLRQGGLDEAVHPHTLDVRLAGDVRHHRGVDLPDVDEAALEAELARLLDDQPDAPGRRGQHADDVGLLGQDAQQDRIEVGHGALEELLRHHLVAELLDERRLHLDRPPTRIVVRRYRGDALEVGMVLLDPLPEGGGLRR